MRKLLYALFLLLSTACARAQKIDFKVKIGAGLATQKINDPTVLSISSITTFNAAILADYNLPHQFAIESGVSYLGKGSRIEQDDITTTPHINYLEIPLVLVKRFKFQSLGYINIGAGGYHAIGFRGHYSYETPGSTTSGYLKFGDGYDVKKNDDGLRFLAGLELKNNVLFTLNYDLGLKNVATDPERDTGTESIYNRLFYLTLGYSF